MFEEDKEKFEMIMKGASVRLKLYENMNAADGAERLRQKYAAIGIDKYLIPVDSAEMDDINKYVQEAKAIAGLKTYLTTPSQLKQPLLKKAEIFTN